MKNKLLFLLFLIPSLVLGSYIITPGGTPTIGGGLVGGTDNSVLFVNPGNTIDQDNANFSFDKAVPSLNLFGFTLLEAPSDPSAGGGLVAPVGSIAFRDNAGVGELWAKYSASNTSWSNILLANSGWSLTGNGGTTAGTNFLGTTDGVDLVFKTTNTERFRITSSGSLDTALGTGILHSDASGVLSSSAVLLGSEVSGTLPTANGGLGLDASASAGYPFFTAGSVSFKNATTVAGEIDHGLLLGLADDDHTQYSLLAGRSGGQILTGGTGSGDDLTLRSTSNVTKGSIILDETTASTDKDTGALVVEGGVGVEGAINLGGALRATGSVRSDASLTLEDPGAGTNTATIQSPTLAGSYTLTLPVDDGTTDQVLKTNGSGVLSWAADISDKGLIKVRLHDNISTTLPTFGSPVNVDNITLVNNDLVLFTNLSSGNNTIYRATVSGGNLTAWTLQTLYEGTSSTAVDGDFVVIKEGDYYADNILQYNGTIFMNFLDNKISYTMADNVTNTVMIELDTTRYQFFFMEYSITRGATTIRAGQLWAGSNGTTADLNDLPIVVIGDIGVTFNANMSGTTLQIRFTTTNTGTTATLKRVIRVW